MRLSRPLAALISALLMLALPWVLPTFYVGILSYAGIYAIAAIGLAALLQAGQVSLGHAAFMGLGAYVSALLSRDYGLNTILTATIAVIATALIASLIGWVTLRLRGHFLPLATLAYGIALSGVFVAWISVTGGSSGLDKVPALGIAGFELRDDRAYATLVWLLVAAAVIVSFNLRRSRVGRAIAALEAHDAMAQCFGVRTATLRVKVFVFSAGMAAIAGVLYVHLLRFISPSPFSLATSFKLLNMTVVGGAGSALGAVAGALTIEGLQWTLQGFFARLGASGNLEIIVFGALLVVILLKYPNGLFAIVERFLPKRTFSAAASASLNASPHAEDSGGVLLNARDIGVRFGGIQALSGVSLELRAGDFVGLIGPNGAGKTTLFSVMSGMRRPTHGAVSFGDSGVLSLDALAQRGLARTFQHVQLIPDMSVVENVMLGTYSRTASGFVRGLLGASRVEDGRAFSSAIEALERVKLGHLAFSLVRGMPLGQQRIVEIARALAADPRLLLLDEPAAGLRSSEKRGLVRLLRNLNATGMTILLVEHDMDLVMSCVARVVVLDRGQKIAEGRPRDIQNDPRVIDAYLGGATHAA